MNTVLAGVALDGKSFFYVNPLEVIPSACMPATDRNHVKFRRQGWFSCACCPPNIARTLASLGEYIFFSGTDSLWVNLFVSGSCETRLGATPVQVQVDSGLPYRGKVSIAVCAQEGQMQGSLRLRIPDYAVRPAFRVNGKCVVPVVDRGYAVVLLSGTEAQVEFSFDMPAELIFADPRVSSDAGKCAVKKGPLVYCLEQQDNGENLAALLIDAAAPLKENFEESLLSGITKITAEGFRLQKNGLDGKLYCNVKPECEPCTLQFIPYCFWANRAEGEMMVWVKYKL